MIQEFQQALDNQAREEAFHLCNENTDRLDTFLHTQLHKEYPMLRKTLEKLLLSHGQSSVERGFSVNKELERGNMHESTLVARRLVCNCMTKCGGLQKFEVTKKLLSMAASA